MKYHKIQMVLSAVFVIFFLQISAFAIEENKQEYSEQQEGKFVNKINFDNVLLKAKEHSYDLKISDYNILISKQGVRSARAEYFPQFNFSAGTEYTKNFRDAKESTVMSVGEAFINPYTRYQSVLGISVGYNLFDFGVRGGKYKIAKEEVILKELENKQKLQELNLSLLDIYSKIQLMSRQTEIYKEILALEEENLGYYERLYLAKEVSKTELNDARVKVSTTKNKISELLSLEQESLNWLAFYTGDKYNIENLNISDIKNSGFDVFSYQDYTKSITWKVHEKYIKKKELELQVAKRNYLPRVNVYGKYYLYGSDSENYGESLKNIQQSNFSVGASMNMPVFDGFRTSANIHKTNFELKQLLIERDKAIAELMTKLANMRSNLTYIDNQLIENSEIVKELSDKEKSTQKLASKKLISPINYNSAQIELLTAKIELEKNSITKEALTKGIQILTEEI